MRRRMKRIAAVLTILGGAVACLAQSGYTTVTGTNACYANGKVQAQWVNGNTSAPIQPNINGGIFPQIVPSNISAAGVFTIRLADNNVISPSSSQWQLTICQTGGETCYAQTLTITGTSQSVTSNFTGAPCSGTATATTPGTVILPTGQTSTKLSTVAITGSYADLSSKPTNFPVTYTDVTTATNQDNRGTLTLVAGTNSYTFTQGPGTAGVWTTAPVCQVQDTTFADQANTTLTVTASTLTIANATNTTDTYTYLCTPGN